MKLKQFIFSAPNSRKLSATNLVPAIKTQSESSELKPAALMPNIRPSRWHEDMSSVKAPKTHDYFKETPVGRYQPYLHLTTPSKQVFSLKEKRILFVAENAGHWKKWQKLVPLNRLDYDLLLAETGKSTKGIKKLVKFQSVSATNEHLDLHELENLDLNNYDCVIAIKDLTDNALDSLLTEKWNEQRLFIDLLFSLAKRVYDALGDKKLSMVSVCLTDNQPITTSAHPYTALVAGFMKSLARERSESNIKFFSSDEKKLNLLFSQIETELAQPERVIEVQYRSGKRYTVRLKHPQPITEHTPLLDKNSVVLATGGGRGVTAVICEELLSRYQCTVITVGRTKLSDVPEHLLKMHPLDFEAYEATFYQEEIKKGNRNIIELKKQYRRFNSANEIYYTLRPLHERAKSDQRCYNTIFQKRIK